MLLWVYIHTGQAWKMCLATVWIYTHQSNITQASYSPGYITPTQQIVTFINPNQEQLRKMQL
jgi:hypothetical protein